MIELRNDTSCFGSRIRHDIKLKLSGSIFTGAESTSYGEITNLTRVSHEFTKIPRRLYFAAAGFIEIRQAV